MSSGRIRSRSKHRLAPLVAVLAACRPEPSPVASPPLAPAPPAAAAPSDGGALDARTQVALKGADAAATDSGLDPSDASALGASAEAAAPGPPFRGYCFGWVHLGDFSTDCYRSRAECVADRRQMGIGGHVLTAPCQKTDHATCTTILGDGKERCFGNFNNCIRYRKYVAKMGVETSWCVDR
jgi:hypothetical protein